MIFYFFIFFLREESEEKMKKREDKRMVKHEFLQNCPFWTYINKNQHIHFLVHGSFLLVHIWFTPSEGPKSFVNWILKKSDRGSCTMKLNHGPYILDTMHYHVHTRIIQKNIVHSKIIPFKSTIHGSIIIENTDINHNTLTN